MIEKVYKEIKLRVYNVLFSFTTGCILQTIHDLRVQFWRVFCSSNACGSFSLNNRSGYNSRWSVLLHNGQPCAFSNRLPNKQLFNKPASFIANRFRSLIKQPNRPNFKHFNLKSLHFFWNQRHCYFLISRKENRRVLPKFYND